MNDEIVLRLPLLEFKKEYSTSFRILILNDHGIFGGGAETRIRTLVEALLENNLTEQIHILQYYSASEKEKQHNDTRLFFHTIPKGISSYSFAKRIMKKYNISIVQAHNLLVLKPYVLFAAKTLKIPIIWWAHDYWLLCAKRSFIDPYHAAEESLCPKSSLQSCHRCMPLHTELKHRLWKYFINLSTLAVAPSQILQKIYECEHVLSGRWKIITPWIDNSFLYQKQYLVKKKIPQKNLLFVGSLMDFKGAWVAARALKQLVARYPEATLLFVGDEQHPDNPYRKKIELICKRDGVERNVAFLGRKEKEEILSLYQNTAVYLCPTVCMESFGLNWAEAMAAGIPVVASAIGSIPEYITHRETGLLFPPRDYHALAHAVFTLLDNPSQARKIADEGRKYAQSIFTLDHALPEIIEIYRFVLERKSEN